MDELAFNTLYCGSLISDAYGCRGLFAHDVDYILQVVGKKPGLLLVAPQLRRVAVGELVELAVLPGTGIYRC